MLRVGVLHDTTPIYLSIDECRSEIKSCSVCIYGTECSMGTIIMQHVVHMRDLEIVSCVNNIQTTSTMHHCVCGALSNNAHVGTCRIVIHITLSVVWSTIT